MTVFTKSYPLRMQHSLNELKEGRHGHSANLHVSLDVNFNERFDAIVQSEVVSWLDGKIVNSIIANPTGESIVEWAYDRLTKTQLQEHLMGLTLQETSKNRFLSSRNKLFLG